MKYKEWKLLSAIMLSEETHCTVSWWQGSLLIYIEFASSQVRILYLGCGRQLPSYTDAKRPKLLPQSHLSTQLRLFCREAIGTSGSHWLLHLLRTSEKYFLLSKVCDKYLLALWGFWVKTLGKKWLIVLGLWWVTWTFGACSLNIG